MHISGIGSEINALFVYETLHSLHYHKQMRVDCQISKQFICFQLITPLSTHMVHKHYLRSSLLQQLES